MKIYSSKYKLMKAVLSIALCICIMGVVTIDSMYCAPAVVPLIEWGAPLVAKILVTAGVTFLTYQGAKEIANRCITGMPSDIEQACQIIGSDIRNGVATISSNVWSYVKSWADTNFDVGENMIETVVESNFESSLYYPKDMIYVVQNWDTGVMVEHEIQWVFNGTDYSCAIDGQIVSGSSLGIGSATWNKISGLSPYNNVDVYDGSIDIRFKVDYIEGQTGASTVGGIINRFYDSTAIYTVRSYTSSPDVVGQDGAIDNPDYTYTNVNTGDNSISLDSNYADKIANNPADVNEADMETAINNDVLNKTATDAANEDLPTADEINTGILQGILDRIYSVPDLLTGIYNNVTGVMSNTLNGILSALTGTIAGTLQDIKANTQEEEIDNNNIFDFFISLLLILKHLVLIVLEFIVFVVVLKDIPAQSNLFNENTKAVIDYMHNSSLPVFGVSFMQIINAFIGILVAVNVIRIINKNVRANQ